MPVIPILQIPGWWSGRHICFRVDAGRFLTSRKTAMCLTGKQDRILTADKTSGNLKCLVVFMRDGESPARKYRWSFLKVSNARLIGTGNLYIIEERNNWWYFKHWRWCSPKKRTCRKFRQVRPEGNGNGHPWRVPVQACAVEPQRRNAGAPYRHNVGAPARYQRKLTRVASISSRRRAETPTSLANCFQRPAVSLISSMVLLACLIMLIKHRWSSSSMWYYDWPDPGDW